MSMEHFINSKGWAFLSACGCVPKRSKYGNPSYPGYIIKLTPARQTWEIVYNNATVARGQNISLEAQYGTIFK